MVTPGWADPPPTSPPNDATVSLYCEHCYKKILKFTLPLKYAKETNNVTTNEAENLAKSQNSENK